MNCDMSSQVPEGGVHKSDMLPSGWSDGQGVYSLMYQRINEESDPATYLLKVITVEGMLLVHLLVGNNDTKPFSWSFLCLCQQRVAEASCLWIVSPAVCPSVCPLTNLNIELIGSPLQLKADLFGLLWTLHSFQFVEHVLYKPVSRPSFHAGCGAVRVYRFNVVLARVAFLLCLGCM